MIWVAAYLLCGAGLFAARYPGLKQAARRRFAAHRLECETCADIEEGTLHYSLLAYGMLAVTGLVTMIFWLPLAAARLAGRS